MAGRYYNLDPTPINFRAIWDRLHALDDNLTAAQTTIATQATTISSLTTEVTKVKSTAQTALVKATPAPPVPVSTPPPQPQPPPGTQPPPTGPPNPPGTQPPAGTGVLTHGFDLSVATVYNSPSDIASWPVAGSISKVTIDPTLGVYITTPTVSPQYSSPPPGPGEWPQPSSGESSGLQYTVWVVLKVSGTWYTSGFIQMWIGRPGTGAALPIGANFAANWAYDSRWGALDGQTPTPGTQMGFFVSAGNARGFTDVNTVRERSEVVLLNLPDAATGAVYT